ncbi:putative methyltransferase DDB_G0268948 [Physella acuta]|uniref:putative methyltransferase DDB_G0268948 n=1 Tax=Physella acuta TaxID=109671 RepID=UPI0027DD0F0D|nr:putative methyltransferase DDB_G0268948 [Physella acuta]XP_059159778.1 putative methyltransferase DDB_G0268948 [Physella acuta]
MHKDIDESIHELHTGKTFAKMYAAFRPSYPQEVYDKIMSYHLERPGSPPCDQQLAVDVCCGTGQSTLPLTNYFGKVIGTDISEDQIGEVRKDVENLETVVASAEELHFLATGSVDLLTIATGLHWVDRDRFFKEVRRVLRPGGTFAAYSYRFDALVNKEADTYMENLRETTFAKYLTSKLDVVDNKYSTIIFPFCDIKKHDGISMNSEMPLDMYMLYLSSYHYINMYKREFPQSNIMDEICTKLARFLSDGNTPIEKISVKSKFNVFIVLGRNI